MNRILQCLLEQYQNKWNISIVSWKLHENRHTFFILLYASVLLNHWWTYRLLNIVYKKSRELIQNRVNPETVPFFVRLSRKNIWFVWFFCYLKKYSQLTYKTFSSRKNFIQVWYWWLNATFLLLDHLFRNIEGMILEVWFDGELWKNFEEQKMLDWTNFIRKKNNKLSKQKKIGVK